MLPKYYYSEVPITFWFVIVRQKALEGNLVEFLLEFNPLNNQYLSVFISMGTDLDIIYDWLSDKKLVPQRDYFISNAVEFMFDNEKDFPKTPSWLTIFRNQDGALCCDYQIENTKKFFYTDFLDFKGSLEDAELY